MNPVLALALAKLEETAATEALTALTLLAKDLADGKTFAAASRDLGDTAAEEQARLLNAALDELDKLGG